MNDGVGQCLMQGEFNALQVVPPCCLLDKGHDFANYALNNPHIGWNYLVDLECELVRLKLTRRWNTFGLRQACHLHYPEGPVWFWTDLLCWDVFK